MNRYPTWLNVFVLVVFLAGVLLGIVDRLSSTYIGTYVTTIVLLVCAALTIVLRPSGLLGRAE